MALEYPYVKQTVVDGVTDVLAVQHNHQEDQIDEVTKIAYRRDNNCVVALQGYLTASLPIDVLTSRALDTGTNIRVRIGASNLITPTTVNGPGPGGTGIPTVLQRFVLPTLAEMGCTAGSGDQTILRIVFYENLAEVGWIDAPLWTP
jgi:hypothetical protein